MHLGDRGPKWQEESPQSKRIRPHPPWRSQMGGEAHGNLFKGTEDKPIYLGGERGGEITSHGGSVDCRKKI